MTLGKHLPHIHRHRTGDKRDQRAVPSTVVKLAKAGAGKPHHCHNQPARVTQRFYLAETLFNRKRVDELMFGQNDDVLNFSNDMHIDAAIDILARGGLALIVFNGG